MKLSQALDTFLTARKAENLSAQTVSWYRKRLNQFVDFVHDRELSEITFHDLLDFVVSLQEQQVKWARHKYHNPVPGSLSPFTVHGYVRILQAFYHWQEENGYISESENAARNLKRPKLPKQAPKEITQDDLLKLIAVSRYWGRYPKRNYAMLLFLSDTGCRVAGLVNVRVDQLDLKRRRVMIVEKGNKSRWVFFGHETKRALAVWLSVHPRDNDFLFVSERGQITDSGLRMVLRHLAKAAGVEGRINPHAFRHAFAKRTMARGGDVAFLSDLMGHSDIKITRDSYLIFRTDELQHEHDRYSSVDSILPRKHHHKKVGQLSGRGLLRATKKPRKYRA